MPETIFLSESNLTVLNTSSISDSGNIDKKTILVSVLGKENLNNVLIEPEEGEKYCSTLINKPIVAYLKFDKNGAPTDFGGHELKKKYNSDNELVYYFATTPIGTHTDARVEEREIPGYGKVKCIVADIELWASRFPEYYEVAEKLIGQGKLSTSWEIDTRKYEFANGKKKLLEFEFLGNAFLGSAVTPAVTGAGVITSEIDLELREAIIKDLAVASIEKEDSVLGDEEKNIVVEETAEVVEPAEVIEPEVEHTAEPEVSNEELKVPEETPEVSSLTMWDILHKVYSTLSAEVFSAHGFDEIERWDLDTFVAYPEEHAVIYSVYRFDKTSAMLKIVYAVENDEVSIVSMSKVEMVFIETSEIEKDKAKIAELSEKLVEINTELESTKATVAELSPYKAEYEKAQAEIAEAEKQKTISELKNKYIATKMISESEFDEVEELKVALAELDESKLKMIVADRILEGRKPDVLEVIKDEKKEAEVKGKLNLSSYLGFKSEPSKDGSSVNKFIYGM